MSALPAANDERPRLTIVSAWTLLRDFKPIESIVDGLPMPRGGLVCITAPTGHGKTTLSALLQAALCRGLPFAGREVTRGSVLVLAGENPDDYTMHLAATTQDLGLKGEDLAQFPPMGQLLVVPGTFQFLDEVDYLADYLSITCADGLVAVFVDTSAAFFSGDDENDNAAMRRHASALRELCNLPGRPTVFVLCHPTKNAGPDNLVPRGGGAFLAEVDVNLTLWKDEAGIVTLHHGKSRGPGFDPIRFELASIELEGMKDARGRPIFSVAGRHLAEERAEQIAAKAGNDQDVLLVAMQRRPGASLRELAAQCGWTTGMGKPQVGRTDRTLKELGRGGHVEQDRKGTWRLTPKGQKEADRLP
jgi:hypothetical protein